MKRVNNEGRQEMMKSVASVIAQLETFKQVAPEDIIREISARGLYLDTYDPAVKSDRHGNRSKYTPKKEGDKK